MKLTNNKDFFEKTIGTSGEHNFANVLNNISAPNKTSKPKVLTSAGVSALTNQTADILNEMGYAKMAARIQQISRDVSRERFVVSVVGEFNHGKSTFLNHLLNDAAKLPVADLPTTAILTRIRYANRPQMAVFDEKGSRKALLDIKPESWNGLVANNFGQEEPKGSVIVGIPDNWLGKHNLEIIDCPGAGDLSEERARVIGEVLNRTDGAVIALNATAALSNSERLFIKNRILARKTPFTLVIINKLDLVKKEERSGIIKYIKDVLALNKMDIPVYVPYDIEMPDDNYCDIIGLDKVKTAVEEWVYNPHRQQLTDAWVKSRVAEVVQMALDALSEQEKMLRLDEAKRLELIESKKQALSRIELEWGNLELKLQAKSNDCYSRFLDKVEEYKRDITERLQFESAHAGSPERWWKEDYPYRLKVELANMSVGLDNVTSRIIAGDVRWFNDNLNQKFQTFVQAGDTSVTNKEDFISQKSERDLEFENLTKRQNVARVGTVALSLALAPVLGLVATLGVGTVGTIATGTIFKKKIEEQRKAIKEGIAKDIPAIILQATSNSEKRIQALYDEIITDSGNKRAAWLESQQMMIEQNNQSKTKEEMAAVAGNISKLTEIMNKIS